MQAPPSPASPDLDPSPPSLLDRAAQGYRATLFSQAVRLACKLLSVVVLARLVSPADHGVFAMAASVFYVIVIFRDVGLGAAAIQARELSEEQCTTLWHAHLALGVILAAIGAALGPLAARFYHESDVAALLATISLTLVLLGVNGWPRALLARELQFAALNRIETVGALCGTAAMIAAGALGAGAYAFASFLVVSEGAMLVGTWRACRWRPRAPARWSSLRELGRVGGDITGYNVLLTISQQIDSVLMGRWFGPAALGFYNRPVQLIGLPVQHIAAPLANVMLATLPRLRTEPAKFRQHVREAAMLMAYLTLPLAVLCFALPHEIVRVLLGRAWPESAPLLRALAVSAAAWYLGGTTYALCVATGRARRLATITGVSLAAIVAGMWFGRGHGPIGLATGLAAANVALLLPRLWWSTRGTAVTLGDYGRAFLGPLVFSAALAWGLAAGRFSTVAAAPAPVVLATSLACGAAACALVASVWPRLRTELLHVWRHRPGPRDLSGNETRA